ncbi:carboxyl-terminal processing protease CtpA [Acaryochloris sp. IP29b_bin.137]|uniref:carboxyl-terminal processing protease CtpA n=1 Tax=Acaryochloris sp. IP29b_bin.137 TaxID=2969217 RepID=UPI0026016DBE|nr:carboxyl-terminal processing protease CtpA [Acaryochloris sp. IP29b_bin.137]
MIKRIISFICIFQFVLALVVVPPATALTEEQLLYNEAWRLVDQAYVDDSFNHQDWRSVRQQALTRQMLDRESTYRAIREMLDSLDDPFTRLLQPKQYQSLKTSTSGELTGVGLQIIQNETSGYLEVLAPIEGSPAAIAGVQAADLILNIDNASTLDLTLDEAAERMRGPIGSSVQLKVQRPDQGVLVFPIKRDRIAINPVFAELRPQPNGQDVGFIRLRQFNANATQEMQAAITKLEAAGADGYILDLRNNPGGLLQAGVEIAQMWLEPSPIVYTVDRQGIRNSFDAKVGSLTDAPLVVLVNRGSASASEILAGALQDNGRAQLVGEQTFGKGSIQSLFNLSDGSGLAITIAKYETPSHRNINKVGIKPDKVVTLSTLRSDQVGTSADTQYQQALKILAESAVIASAAST